MGALRPRNVRSVPSSCAQATTLMPPRGHSVYFARGARASQVGGSPRTPFPAPHLAAPDLISSFLKRHQATWGQISKIARNIDWSGNAEAETRELASRLDAVVVAAVREAAELGVGEARFFRNLAASASRHEVGAALILLLCASEMGVFSDTAAASFAMLSMADHPGEVMVLAAARGQLAPTVEGLRQLYRRTPDDFVVASADLLARRTSSLRGVALWLADDPVGRAASGTAVADALVQVAGNCAPRSLIGMATIARLLPAWRQALLAVPRPEIILTAALATRLRAQPITVKDSPARLAAEAAIARASKAFDHGDPLTDALLPCTAPEVLRLWQRTAPDVWRVLLSRFSGRSINAHPSPEPLEAPVMASLAKVRTPFADALLITLACIASTQRPSSPLTHEDDLRRAARARPDVTAVAVPAAAGSTQALLLGCLPKPRRRKLIADSWKHLLSGRPTPETIVEVVRTVRPKLEDVASGARLVDLITASVDVPELEPSILKAISKVREQRGWQPAQRRAQRRDVAFTLISHEALRAYEALGDRAAPIVGLVENWFQQERDTPTRSLFLTRLASEAPRAFLALTRGRPVRARLLRVLIESASFWGLEPAARAEIFQTPVLGGGIAGLDCLRLLGHDHPLVASVLADRYLAAYARVAFSLEKPLPAQQEIGAPDLQALSAILAAVVRRPAEAAQLAERFRRDEILAALPQTLAGMRGRPRLSAALELAAHSDLRALPLLLRHVRRVAPPFEPQQLGTRFDDLYRTWELPKRRGGKRTISSPALPLKKLQRLLLPLLEREELPTAATGFRRGISIRDNAAAHSGRAVVVNADIRDFFPTTEYGKVLRVCRSLAGGALSPFAQRFLAEILCHRGRLATGAPSSPAVANLVLRGMDRRLTGIAQKLGVTYTRYADDLTFSGGDEAVWMLKPSGRMLGELGYALDREKTNIFRRGRRQTVTGLVVNDIAGLARPLRRKLRAAVHRRCTGQPPEMRGKAVTDEQLRGWLAFLAMLAPAEAAAHRDRLRGAPGWLP